MIPVHVRPPVICAAIFGTILAHLLPQIGTYPHPVTRLSLSGHPMFKPAVWLASFSARKIVAGDLNAGVRQLVVMSQTQGALLLVEVGLFVAAIWRIVSTLPSG